MGYRSILNNDTTCDAAFRQNITDDYTVISDTDIQCPVNAYLVFLIDPVTRLKFPMGPIRGRGPYSLYLRHVRASMLPKKRLSTRTMHFK